jgi:hypothetical protein
LEAQKIRVAVRLRRFEYYIKYAADFTIRWERRSGTRTEIHKIRDGLVDYLLYGFIDRKEEKIIQYFIGDLKIFKESKERPKVILPNKDGNSKLAVYSILQFPEEFILKFYPERKVSDFGASALS